MADGTGCNINLVLCKPVHFCGRFLCQPCRLGIRPRLPGIRLLLFCGYPGGISIRPRLPSRLTVSSGLFFRILLGPFSRFARCFDAANLGLCIAQFSLNIFKLAGISD